MSQAITVTALYAPASRPELLPKALASGADAVLVDLEDAVLATHKDTARANAMALLDDLPARPGVQVRVNHPRGRFGPSDLWTLGTHPAMRAGRVGLRLPKVAGPDDVDLALDMLNVDTPPRVHCLLESAAGIENADRIAAHPAVAGLALGEADLATELGLRGEDSYAWVRSRIVIAAAAAGLPAPAMAVYTDLADPEGLAASCAKGRALGMFGRSALHPLQLPVIAAAFRPDQRELSRAHEVVEAAAGAEADGSGAIALPDGRFIDAPMVAAARRTIQLAARLA
ncbi:MAG TPA: CoA ester lyase [Stackebrandtia sp.]|jgi:citrate lyase subunit beta/citryl-CoA lyase|uniref:HpcH/HpaI aldolase/citrate lyase family protein n=1 Tax=Stackebrandtia sp. TaxID=2023065 RepID=UPI002D4E31C4|nr:CoA ester lyase [Stackebrandtia sp.]HZE40446.1 CoA ester lyase [Stackebrandtia sp.]